MKNLEASKELYRLCKEDPKNLEAIKAAYHNGGDVNYSFPGYGLTPLHMAANNGSAELIEWLFLHEANPNAYSYNIKTPLDEAILAGRNKSIIELMTSYGCNRAGNKGDFFKWQVTERTSPFMLDDTCIMKAFCGDGFKLYSAVTDSPYRVNFFGGDGEKNPRLIGALSKDGEIILTKEFSDLYFPVGEKPYLHEYVHQFNKELKNALMEEYKESAFPKEWFDSFCARSFYKARRTAIFKDADGTEYGMPCDVTFQTAAEILCGKTTIKDSLDEIRNTPNLKRWAAEYVGFTNACIAHFEGKIEPYEYAIAEALSDFQPGEELDIYAKGEASGTSLPRGSIMVSTEWWENIERIEKNGKCLYDSKDFEKEDIER